MAEYPRDAEARRAERERLTARIVEEARVAAGRVGRSLKCRGQTLLSPARPLHAGDDGGCRNDGTGCLCECHDRKDGTDG